MLHTNVIEKSRFRTLEGAELEAVSGGDVDVSVELRDILTWVRNGAHMAIDPAGAGEDIINERVTELALENGGTQYLGNFDDGIYAAIGDTGFIGIDRDKNGEYDLIAIPNGSMWTYVTGTGDVLNINRGPQYIDLNILPWDVLGGLPSTFTTFDSVA